MAIANLRRAGWAAGDSFRNVFMAHRKMLPRLYSPGITCRFQTHAQICSASRRSAATRHGEWLGEASDLCRIGSDASVTIPRDTDREVDDPPASTRENGRVVCVASPPACVGRCQRLSYGLGTWRVADARCRAICTDRRALLGLGHLSRGESRR